MQKPAYTCKSVGHLNILLLLDFSHQYFNTQFKTVSSIKLCFDQMNLIALLNRTQYTHIMLKRMDFYLF